MKRQSETVRSLAKRARARNAQGLVEMLPSQTLQLKRSTRVRRRIAPKRNNGACICEGKEETSVWTTGASLCGDCPTTQTPDFLPQKFAPQPVVTGVEGKATAILSWSLTLRCTDPPCCSGRENIVSGWVSGWRLFRAGTLYAKSRERSRQRGDKSRGGFGSSKRYQITHFMR